MKGTKQIRAVILGAAALGAIALAPLAARADNGEMSTTMTAAPMAATPLSGSVVRYYIDRSGYVTAADIQTSSGISMVRFSPYMGQRLYTSYPVGAQTSLFVVGDDTAGWTVVGSGSMAPSTVGWVAPQSDLQMLDSEPFIMADAKMQTWTGKLSRIVTNDMGDVIGLILDGRVLVRVPREVRHGASDSNGTGRVASLFKGAWVEVRGYEEAPRYGALSSFEHRVAGRAFIINGKAAGTIAFPRMKTKGNVMALFNGVDIGGATMSTEETRALEHGYTLYTPAPSGM